MRNTDAIGPKYTGRRGGCYCPALLVGSLVGRSPRVVSLGLGIFAEDLERLGVPVVHLDWRPPATASPALVSALERLEARTDVIDRANAEAFDRLVNGEPVLVDCRPAWEAL